MFEQSRRLSEPLRWGRREKTAVAAALQLPRARARSALGAYALVERLARARRLHRRDVREHARRRPSCTPAAQARQAHLRARSCGSSAAAAACDAPASPPSRAASLRAARPAAAR